MTTNNNRRGQIVFQSSAFNSAFNNFLLGQATSSLNAEGINTRFLRVADYSLFLRDDWKLSQRLTPYQGADIAGFNQVQSTAESVYNSLQTSLTRRLCLLCVQYLSRDSRPTPDLIPLCNLILGLPINHRGHISARKWIIPVISDSY